MTFSYTVKQAGDLLVLGTYIASASASVSSVGGSLGEDYVAAGSQSGGTSGAICSGLSVNVQLFYANAVAAGSDTIMLTQGGTDGLSAFLLEYAATGEGAKLDARASAAGTTGTMAMTAGSLTTTGATDLVVALFADKAQTGSMTVGNGFAAQAFDDGFAAMIEDDLPAGAAPGTVVPGATEAPPTNDASPDGDPCWAAVSVAFR